MDYGFSLTTRIDSRDVERLSQRIREADQATANLRRTMTTILTPEAQQRFEAFGRATMAAATGGVTSRQGLADIRQLNREVVQLIRQAYTERRQEIEGQFAREEATVRARHRGRMSGLLTPMFGRVAPPEERHRAVSEFREELRTVRRLQREAMTEQAVEEQATLREIEAMRGAAAVGAAGGGAPPDRPGGGGLFGGIFGGRRWGGFRGVLGGVMRGLGVPLGFGAIGAGYLAGRGIVTQALSDEELYEGMIRRLGTPEEYLGSDISEARRRMFRISGPEGLPLFGPGLSARAVQGFTSLGGIGGPPRTALAPAQTAAMVGFGMGVGPEAGAEFFGQLARMGQVRTGTQGVDDVRRFATMIGETIALTGMRGREPEVMGAAIQFMQSTLRTAVLPPALRDVLDFQTRLVQGAPATEQAGMRGELGLRVMGAAQEAITGTSLFPNIGSALMRPMMLMTMLRAGVRDPAEMEMYRAQGMFARLPGGQMLIDALMGTAGGYIGAGGIGEVAGAQMFNMSQPLFRRFLTAIQQPTPRRLAEEFGLGGLEDVRRAPATEILERVAAGGISEAQARKELQELRERPLTRFERFSAERADMEWMLTEIGSKLTPVFTGLTHALDRFTTTMIDLLGGGDPGLFGYRLGGIALGGAFGGLTGLPFGKTLGAVLGGIAAGEGYRLYNQETGPPPRITGAERTAIEKKYLERPFWESFKEDLGLGGEPGGYMQGSRAMSRAERAYVMAMGMGIPRSVAEGIARQETAGGAYIRIGSKGERGLFQGKPSTFHDYVPGMTETQMEGPEGDPIMLLHMRRLWFKYGDPLKVAAAWQSGEETVDRLVSEHGALWFGFLGPRGQKYLKEFQEGLPGYGAMGVPGTSGTPMPSSWWETAVRDGIRFTIDPVTVTIRTDRGEETTVELNPRESNSPSGNYHGPLQSEVAP